MNSFDVSSLDQLNTFSIKLLSKLNDGDVVFFHGDLGSGKTTLIQHLIKNLGYEGRVKSPTYNLYDVYELENQTIIHMDLYRLSTPEELYYLGIEEIFNGENMVFIEWPEKGKGALPESTFEITIQILNENKRELNLSSSTK